MAGKDQFGFPIDEGDIKLGLMARLWFDTYYDPSMSPAENVNQAEAAVSNGWQPISWPKEMADGA
jgi:hypothetical protein